MIVKVPPGTVVTDAETKEVIADLVEHGQRAVIAKGGRGGRGNSRLRPQQIQHQSYLNMVSQDKKEM